MKAADLIESKHYRDRLSSALEALGLEEQATCVVEWRREEDRQLAVATDRGLVIVTQGPDRLGGYVLNLAVHPWTSVEGVEITAQASSVDRETETVATVNLKKPELKLEPSDRVAESADFAAACLAHI